MKRLVCHLSRLRRAVWRLPWCREPNPWQQVEWSRWLHQPSHVDAFADEKTHPSMGTGSKVVCMEGRGVKRCDVPKWCRSSDVSSDWRVLEVQVAVSYDWRRSRLWQYRG